MRRYSITIIAAAIAAIVFSFAAYGSPSTLEEAAQHATVVGALLLPVSLLLLVQSLDLQAQSMQQMQRENFLALQVQALAALIEDDRETLNNMERQRHESGRSHDEFPSIVRRRNRRREELNRLVGQSLNLPRATESGQ